jgi:hypothetical protein
LSGAGGMTLQDRVRQGADGCRIRREAHMAKWQVFESDTGDFGVTKDGAVFRRGLKSAAAGFLLARQQRSAGDIIGGNVARLTITEATAEPVSQAYRLADEGSLGDAVASWLNTHTSAAAPDSPAPPPPVAADVASQTVPADEPAAFDALAFLSDVARDIVASVHRGEVDAHLVGITEAEAAGAKRKSVLAAVAARQGALA